MQQASAMDGIQDVSSAQALHKNATASYGSHITPPPPPPLPPPPQHTPPNTPPPTVHKKTQPGDGYPPPPPPPPSLQALHRKMQQSAMDGIWHTRHFLELHSSPCPTHKNATVSYGWYIGIYTILPSPIWHGVWHEKGGVGRGACIAQWSCNSIVIG